MKLSKYLASLLITSLLFGCTSSNRLKNESLKPYPNTLATGFHYKLYHQSEEFSTLYLQTNGDEYRITVRAYESFRDKDNFYKNSQQLTFNNNSINSIKIPISKKQYALEILLFNISTNQVYSDAIWVDKTITNEQTLNVFDDNNEAFLKSYVKVMDGLQFSSSNTTLPLYIKYFDEKYQPAPPPHVYKTLLFSPLKGAKNTLRIPQNEVFTFVKEGLYFIHSDTTSENGIFIRVVDSDFPKLTKAEDLTLSIRYITKNEEYNRLTSKNTDTKDELDRFWLSRGGNKERARALIRLYYNRIQITNEYFTTYKEGWKTDKGIIYTIYGKPTRIQKTEKTEYWYYKRTPYRDYVDFTFEKENGVFVLKRSPILEGIWSRQVYAWRKGEVI